MRLLPAPPKQHCLLFKKAGSAQARIAALGYETLVLPSSSPAYTLTYAEKLAGWKSLRPFVPVSKRR